MQIVIATANAGKAKEFRQMLGGERFQWSDLSAHGGVPEAEETGHTFRANACLKASHYATHLKSWALADDSGLAVDALGGKPGVLSARWAMVHQRGKGDADNNATLLAQLADVPDDRRTARFVCVLALSDPRGRIVLTTRDALEGVMLRAPRGHHGFGYDPLFFVPRSGKTTAEMSPEEKHAISHRGKALRRMKQLMERMVG
ncbi:MAG TPA: RdgB/HAM1 family non-canonical purine NTP pyrophosphatase [Tepidisphaeraceae bacterium]|nr:RdgB/HAM1 family non-canonical purine NTP pyrophosphatase [Tepidisphaeraceae bacterium]